jgi:cyclopropane fatty-acyl-phospholipid synthase-like methyltransferase
MNMTIDKEIKLLEQHYNQLSKMYDKIFDLSEQYDDDYYDAALHSINEAKNSIYDLLTKGRVREYRLEVAMAEARAYLAAEEA